MSTPPLFGEIGTAGELEPVLDKKIKIDRKKKEKKEEDAYVRQLLFSYVSNKKSPSRTCIFSLASLHAYATKNPNIKKKNRT
jgi:hypothetical protein